MIARANSSTKRAASREAAKMRQGRRFAGRYCIESVLGSGGTAVVYCVLDEATQRRVALKHLTPSQDARTVPLFRREYQILAGLRHPRIIEVYEYGVEDDSPFYTMELLDGDDMRQLAPLPVDQACRYLRDVASSLALLHARGFVHRDISARNVRATPDGHCKLLDFGSLSPMGDVPDIVGTPPFIAPEALLEKCIDERADIYALGALLYWMLTGRHAFPARAIRDLPFVWKQPPLPPTSVAVEVPEAVEELIFALLNFDSLARPRTAAEVIDRLNAAAKLSPEPLDKTANSYLFSQVVGRAEELKRIRNYVKQAHSGAGGVVVIESAAGMGRSRVLAEAAVLGRLEGALVVQLDLGRYSNANTALRAIAGALLDASPERALQAAESESRILGALVPEIRNRFRSPSLPPIPQSPGEWRGRVLNAMTEWVLRLSEEQPLVITADDIDDATEEVASLFASLARAASDHRLLLLVSLRTSSTMSPAIGALRDSAEIIALRGLTRPDTTELVQGVFGSVDKASILGAELHGRTDGNLLLCTEYLRLLVDSGLARYVDGTWVLPDHLTEFDPPASVEQVWDAKILRLPRLAKTIATALSVCRAPFSVELARTLVAEYGSMSRVFEATTMNGETAGVLEELVREGVLEHLGELFRFRNDGVRVAAQRRLLSDHRILLHGAAGEALAVRADESVVDAHEAGYHLIEGGKEAEGARILAEIPLRMSAQPDELRPMIPALAAAFRVQQRTGRSAVEMLPIAYALAVSAYYVDYQLAIVHDNAILDVLERATGLSTAKRLRSRFGAALALVIGVVSAFVAYCLAPRRLRFPSFAEHFRVLFRCTATLSGAASICLDGPRIRRYATLLSPITIVVRDGAAAVIQDFCLSLLRLVRGRESEAFTGLSVLKARLEDPHDLQQFAADYRKTLLGGVLFALGALESMREGRGALECAEQLDALGWEMYRVVADEVRFMWHMFRGDWDEIERYRAEVELHAIRLGTAWHTVLWSPPITSVAQLRLGDRIGLKRTAEQLDRLSNEVPSLFLYSRLARVAYLSVHGDHESSLEASLRLLEEFEPREYSGWPLVASFTALEQNRRGEHADAERICRHALNATTSEDRAFTILYLGLELELAVAEAGCGRIESSRQLLEKLVREHSVHSGPVTLGSIYEASARVALIARDAGEFEKNLREVEACYRPTAHPALTAKYEELRVQGERRFSEPPPAPSDVHSRREADLAAVSQRLRSIANSRARAEMALAIVLERARLDAGMLFMRNGLDVRLMATRGDIKASPVLRDEVQRLLNADDAETASVTAMTVSAGQDAAAPSSDGRCCIALLCCSSAEGIPTAVGALALPASPSRRPVDISLLATIAAALS